MNKQLSWSARLTLVLFVVLVLLNGVGTVGLGDKFKSDPGTMARGIWEF
jgi:hypothetical protein